MARKGLRLDLRTVLREAIETGRGVTREGIAVEGDDGRVQMVTLTVEPLRRDGRSEPLFLVLFDDRARRSAATRRAAALGAGRTAPRIELERELRETRERLQSMIEEYETASRS